jgi:hypothetical protein
MLAHAPPINIGKLSRIQAEEDKKKERERERKRMPIVNIIRMK